MLIKAFLIARKAHKGQKDKGGKPYILHPIRVSCFVHGRKNKTVALLHDTIEDTAVTLEMLQKRGFDADIIKALESITKIPNEPYDEYLKRVRNNDIARTVKLADLKHNTNLKRLKTITNGDLLRVCKYFRAEQYLKGE